MKSKILFLFLIVFLTSLFAQDVHITIKKTAVAPIIDGAKDVIWESVEVHDQFNIVEGAPVDEIDCSPSFHVMWDDTYLYYYVKVIDDYLNVDETPASLRDPSGGWGWADDCVELYLDGDNSKTAKWNEDMDAAQLWWLPFTNGIYFYKAERMHMDTTNIVYAQKETATGDGWELEVAIPLSDAGITAAAGYIFGFEVDINDDDGVPFTWRPEMLGGRDLKLKWFHTLDQTEPAYFGNAQLSEEFVSVNDLVKPASVTSFELAQNYPNPFNPVTTIQYQLLSNAQVRLDVYDLRGRHVKALVETFQFAGNYNVTFNGADLPGGTYFYKLIADGNFQIKKMTLLK